MKPLRQTSLDLAFRPRARLLQLLGDELIGSPRLAVFELVKNAYDADANSVQVVIDNADDSNASISVTDDGVGMTLATIRDIWLVPAHDHRERQRIAGMRTEKNRLPLGEKGVGRFAAHKLGDKICLVTRAADSLECVVSIDWSQLVSQDDLADATVNVIERPPEVFRNGSTGTKLTISRLRQQWTRGEVRRLHRQITSISSPFSKGSDDFNASLAVPSRPEWLARLPDINELLSRAPWHYRFKVHKGRFDWEYQFRKIRVIDVPSRRAYADDQPLLVSASDFYEDEETPGRKRATVADPAITDGIGPVCGNLYVFDRDKELLSRQGEGQLIETFLNQNSGVRVYRDGIRVYNYGEIGEDWLGLDLSGVNAPSVRISRNIVVGAIELNLEDSTGLKEKTNREGFVEDDTYRRFRTIVRGAMTPLLAERKLDKDKIRQLTAPAQAPDAGSLRSSIGQLRKLARHHKLTGEFEPIISQLERNYQDFRETMVHAGATTIGISLVFHEVDHGVRSLCHMIEAMKSPMSLRRQASGLTDMLTAFTDLARKGERKTYSLNKLIRRILSINRFRFRKHKIGLCGPALEIDAVETEADFVFATALGALNNLLDNAIYWLEVRWPNDEDSSYRQIYIDIKDDLFDGPTIVVADNGPGFCDHPDEVTRPFFTRRPEGVGLGLYYASMVMDLGDGALTLPTPEDVDLPDQIDGAIVALTFPPAGSSA